MYIFSYLSISSFEVESKRANTFGLYLFYFSLILHKTLPILHILTNYIEINIYYKCLKQDGKRI